MSTNKERLIAALQEPLETTLTRYKTHLDGLKEDQVEENRDLYGENVITKGQEDSIIKKIYESIINPFTVILLVIALVSFITNVWLAKPGEEDPTTSIIIVTLVLISGGIRFRQTASASSEIHYLNFILRLDSQSVKTKYTSILFL